MHIHVTHETIYTYRSPVNHLIQILRLTPRGHVGQYVGNWRLEIGAECRVIRDEDSFGNITHAFSIDRETASLRVIAEGDIETEDTNGVVHGAVERLPREFYLRSSALTEADAALRALAARHASAASRDPLAALHALMLDLHQTMTFDTSATTPATSAREAFAARQGVCQDFAQIFVTVSRTLGIPARFVGGYLLRADDKAQQTAGHAWAEAYVNGLGWVGFDAANCLCVTADYVRVAAGLDSLDATPVRGAQRGGDGEAMTVRVKVEPLQAMLTPRPIPATPSQSQGSGPPSRS